MDQAINAIFNFDKGAEVCQVSDPAMDARADLITLMQGLPGVILDLLHAEADAPRLWINAEHFHFNRVAGVDEFARDA